MVAAVLPAALPATAASAAAATPPVGTLDQLSAYLTDGYWQDQGLSRHSFATGAISVDLTALPAEDLTLARWALSAWESVAAVTFTEVSAAALITFSTDPGGAYSDFVFTGTTTVEAGVNVPDSWSALYGETADAYTFQTYLHEIGHALGLGHMGDYDGAASYPVDATFANDSWQVSVMSYFDQVQNTSVTASRAGVVTPMIADILAIQTLYGAATGGATAGATTWGRGGTTGSYLDALFAALAGTPDPAVWPEVWDGGPVALTIWDEGGTDTLDLGFDTRAQRIDMGPEGISDILGLIGNLVIARDTIVERLIAGAGSDLIAGNGASNRIEAGAGHDEVTGGTGTDTIFGGEGNDSLAGSGGHDQLLGGDGADLLQGQSGQDELDGGGGDDTLEGGNSPDRLLGGEGDDSLTGASGADRLEGGAGDDTLAGNSGADTILGGDGADRVDGGQNFDRIEGGAGNDRLDGKDGYDTIEGGAGDDTLEGGNGNDSLLGGDGADSLTGGLGPDTLQGGAGNDTLVGRDGADSLTGGADHDLLEAGPGRDTLVGTGGDDTLSGGQGADLFVFDGGDDLILDFQDGIDTIRIDDALWSGEVLGVGEMLELFGAIDVLAGAAVLEFDTGSLSVAGVVELALLGDDIVFV